LERFTSPGHIICCAPIFAGVARFSCCTTSAHARDAEFQPNRHLEVAPKFLRAMLAHLRARSFDIITMVREVSNRGHR
jgi:hypothetical protein